MKKVILLYHSKTGFSERYAHWIAEALQCPCQPADGIDRTELEAYDIIVYGAGIYSGRLHGLGRLRRLMKTLPRKAWVVYACGVQPAKEQHAKILRANNFPEDQPLPVRFFYFVAGINYEKMGLKDRLLMGFFRFWAWQKALRAHKKASLSKAYSIDLADPIHARPLIEYLERKRR